MVGDLIRHSVPVCRPTEGNRIYDVTSFILTTVRDSVVIILLNTVKATDEL